MTEDRAHSQRKAIPHYPGLYERSCKLIIRFKYEDKTYYEPTGIVSTPGNIKVCEAKLKKIQHEIELDVFSFAEHFPDSPRATKFGSLGKKSIKDLADAWWEDWKKGAALVSPLTLVDYRRCIDGHIVPKLEFITMRKVTVVMLKTWDEGLVGSRTGEPLSVKRRGNVHTVMRSIFNYAQGMGVFGHNFNPWTEYEALKKSLRAKVKKLGSTEGVESLEPFNQEEREAILTNGFSDFFISERNMVGFNFAMGLRIGELIALTWDKVDFTERTLRVDQQITYTIFKECKSRSSRTLGLTDEALGWLKKQQELRAQSIPQTMDFLTDRLNKKGERIIEKRENLRFIFFNPCNNGPYLRSEHFSKRWNKVLIKVGVNPGGDRKRTANYMRHTFASRMLTNGAPMEYVAQQLGNTVEACQQHYATFISDDMDYKHDLKNRYLEG